MNDPQHDEQESYSSIAIIGMACRFPGAPNLDQFWHNLKNGVESISYFEEGHPDHHDEGEPVSKGSHWVNAHGILEGPERFDATFFGIPHAEAGLMDPQQRLLLEVAWHTLEHAGYNPQTHGEALAVYAGASQNLYLFGLLRNEELVANQGRFQLSIANGRDHLTPRLSYLFNLSGPSIPVQTACSTSLVATHVACQSLIHGECDMALAGGSSLTSVERRGYRFRPGDILSPDGHCRAFDASAQGTVPSEGVAMVLLKRLADAREDGDRIHAIIEASAVNNDGSGKIGYTAPSVDGQRRVIEEALTVADVDPADISYVEAHGTGTQLGDPIEIKALQLAYSNCNEHLPKHTCALGSVKTNIGHCDASAGIAGLIKTILCLKHKVLVPTLHFNHGNPQIDFANTYFQVNTETRPWHANTRRAAVSSFGIGGTNAHVILKEGGEIQTGSATPRTYQLITLSGASAEAAKQLAENLADYQASERAEQVHDAIFTMNVGRKTQTYRDIAIVRDNEELCQALRQMEPGPSRLPANTRPEIVFMYPGQGALLEAWGEDLYREEAPFREALDACATILEPLLKVNITELLFAETAEQRAQLQRPTLFQPALFALEYALTQQWIAWGIQPDAVIGHSLGEYVAATQAGIFTLEDALLLVARRGMWCEELPAGAMLAVAMDEETVTTYLDEDLSLAAVNGPEAVVLSGPAEAITRAEQRLVDKARHVRLHTERAFHSAMVDPVAPRLAELIASFKPGQIKIPLVSNLTGQWLEETPAPTYWADHLRQTIRFDEGLATLAARPGRILLEVGPGSVLTRLAREGAAANLPAISSHIRAQAASASMQRALGNLWIEGKTPDWQSYYADEQRCRVPLPLYPFQRRAYWLARPEGETPVRTNDADERSYPKPEDWLYLPGWTRRVPPPIPTTVPDQGWLLFVDHFDDPLATRLRALNQTVIEVDRSGPFQHLSEDRFQIDPSLPGDYQSLWTALAAREKLPTHLVHCWLLADHEDGKALQTKGFDSLVLMAKALAVQPIPVHLSVITKDMHAIASDAALPPESAAILGLLRVLDREHRNVVCRAIDLDRTSSEDALIRELLDTSGHPVVACRRGRHWLPQASRIERPADLETPLGTSGPLVITHGLCETGISLATELARTGDAPICLISRQFFPAKADWPSWLSDQGETDPISAIIQRLQPIEAQVYVHSQRLDEPEAMNALFARLETEHGPLRGIIHLHGDDTVMYLQNQTLPVTHLVSCIEEATVLHGVLDHLATPPEFLLLCSEHPLAAGTPGRASHAGGAAFLAAFAEQQASHDHPTIITHLGWDRPDQGHSITPKAFLQCLQWAVALGEPGLYITTRDYEAQAAKSRRTHASLDQISQAVDHHPRPNLSTPYRAPEGELEETIAASWHSLFSVDRIGADDDFFELGGHSLLAVQLLTKLNEAFPFEFTTQILFENPTIAGLAQWVEQMRNNSDELLDEIEGLSDAELDALLAEEGDEDEDEEDGSWIA